MLASTLTPKQRAAIAFIIAHPSALQPEVAQAVGVSDRTLRVWQQRADYRAALDQASAASSAAALGHVRRVHGLVIMQLCALAFDDPSSIVRLRACATLLDHLRAADLREIEMRLGVLEAAQAQAGET